MKKWKMYFVSHNPKVASSSLAPATTKWSHPIWVAFFLCCELCSRLRPTGSRSTTAKRSRWEIQRRLLWRSGQNLSALQAAINFGHRKSASRGVASVRHYKSFCLNLVNKDFSAFVDVFTSSADAVFIFAFLSKNA